MAGKSSVLAAGILNQIFKNVGVVGLFTADTAVPQQLWASLHTADPGSAGNQGTSEVSYTGYARPSVTRTLVGGWTIAGDVVTPPANLSFGTALNTTGTQVAAWFAIGTTLTGTGTLLYTGTVTPVVNIINGVLPQLTTGTTISEQ